MVFADITGQESTVKALSNAIKSGRIMHAYLFCGPRGTGKTSSARIFAKSLNCENGPTVTPCGKCPGCLDVINSTPVDVIEIDAASNRSVDDARNILEKVQYAPLHGKYKIYIIDEVHMLTNEASNALLKTLEEPPENVVFILATTESQKVLETIVSRCQRYDFKRITTNDIVKRLTFIAKEEKIKINNEALMAIAKNAAGGMRDAVALLDQLSVLGQDEEITVNDVNEILGQLSYDTLFEITESISENNTEKALKILNDVHDRGNEPGRVLSDLIRYLRDMLIVKTCSDKEIVFSMTRINEAFYDKIKTQSEKFDSQAIIYYIEKITAHFAKLKENTNKFMWAELCLIDLTSISKIQSLSELAEKIAVLEEKISSGNISVQTPKPVNTYVPPKPIEKPAPKPQQTEEIVKEPVQTVVEQKEETTLQPADLKEPVQEIKKEPEKPVVQDNYDLSEMQAIWQQLTAEIKGPAKFFFSKIVKPLSITKTKIVISVPSEGAAQQANDESKKSLLQEAACRYFDTTTIQVEVKINKNSQEKKTPELIKPLPEKKEEFKTQKPDLPQQTEKTEPLPKATETTTEPQNQETEPTAEIKTEAKEPIQDFSSDYSDYGDEDINSEDLYTDNDEPEEETVDLTKLSDTARTIMELFDGKITR